MKIYAEDLTQGIVLEEIYPDVENCRWADNSLQLLNNHVHLDVSEYHVSDFSIIKSRTTCSEQTDVVTRGNKPYISLCFPLKGFINHSFEERKQEVLWSAGQSNIIFSSSEDVYSQFSGSMPFEVFEFILSDHYFEKITNDYPALFESAWTRYQQGETLTLTSKHKTMNAQQYRILNEITSFKLMGNVGEMYLDAKIRESLALFLSADVVASDTTRLSVADKIEEAKDIIVRRYLNPPSIPELALLVGTNEFTLKKEFKRRFGKTIYEYLFQYRMELATRYLLDSDKNIQEIAYLVGYEYHTHFCNAFKRWFGVSPSCFREKRG